jgi:riboflavin biosynthesis pyrimidine reductase
MRPLRHSINVTLDGCCHHEVALADLGLIDEYVFLVQPVLAGHGPTLLAGLRERIELELVDRRVLGSGTVVLRYRPHG